MFIYLLFYVVWQNYLNRGQANLICLISEDVGRIFSNFFNIKNPFYRKKKYNIEILFLCIWGSIHYKVYKYAMESWAWTIRHLRWYLYSLIILVPEWAQWCPFLLAKRCRGLHPIIFVFPTVVLGFVFEMQNN